MNTAAIQALEDQYTSGVYTKRPVAIVRGLGAHLWDAEGKEYIDCAGGQGAANLGHANPVVAKAIADQAQVLISCPEMFYNDQRALLEEKLLKKDLPGYNEYMQKVHFRLVPYLW